MERRDWRMKSKYFKLACLLIVIIWAYVQFKRAFETTVLSTDNLELARKNSLDNTNAGEVPIENIVDEQEPHCLFSNHGGHSSVHYVGPMPLTDYLKKQFSNLTFYKCDVCGSYFVWPVLTDSNLSWIYTQVYDHNTMVKNSKYLEDQAKARAFWQYRLISEYIPRMSRQKDLHVLEQGCNEGLLLSKFRNISAHITCFELAPEARVIKDYPEVTVHRKVRVGDEVDDSSVDIYMSSHVAEHVARPREFFQAAHRKLRMGGLLFTEIPHYAGNDKLMLGSNPINVHLTYFTPKAAREFLTEMGLCELFTGYTMDNKGFKENYSRPFTTSLENHAVSGSNLRIVYQKCRET